MMFEVRSLVWDWESKNNHSVIHKVQNHTNIPVVKEQVKAPAQAHASTSKRSRVHPQIPIYSDVSTGTITCGKQLSHLFWIIVLMEQGGFLMDSVEAVSRKKRFEIAKQAIELQEDMNLAKDSVKHFGDCVRTLMTDDRIPVWNPLFMRLLVATSQMNMVKLSDSKLELFAPWKQRRDCIVVQDTVGTKEWKVDTMTDSDVKSQYPLPKWVPEKKTARSKMTRDELYLVCSMWDIHPPKMTKKCMLELISVKLTK